MVVMIDILLSSFNGESFLAEQLDSLLAQTYQDFRVLVRDDGSSDRTSEILKVYANQYSNKITLIDGKNKNLGSSKSFFELLRCSDADFVMFCDQDDVWNKDKLEMMVDFYEKQVSRRNLPVLIHSAALVVDANLKTMCAETERFNRDKGGMEKPFVWQIFQNDVTGCTVLINAAMRDVVNKIDFSKHVVIQHDWFLSQIAYLYNNKFHMPVQTMKYRQHSGNVISARKISFREKVSRKIKRGLCYPYYSQIETLLTCEIPMKEDLKNVLVDFSLLGHKCKIYRILWHIQHGFFRSGNVVYKIYQLLIC